MKIILVTWAYNAEQTIERAINSVLSQTYKNFVYYLIDNGSSDHTGAIIKKYADSDKRIISITRKCNDPYILGKITPEIAEQNDDEDYFCNLDADDEYAADFMEKMLNFIMQNNLDVATCGTDWIDAQTGSIIKHKVIEKTILLEGQQFSTLFPGYHHFMTTLWGGLYANRIVKNCDWEHWAGENLRYSPDTVTCMEFFSQAKRAGILAESLHKYYISHNSITFQYDPKRFESCKQLYRVGEQYLAQYGPISAANRNYLYVVYFIMLQGAVDNLLAASIGFSEKLKNLEEIFQCELTIYLLKNWDAVGIYTKKNNFLSKIEKWFCTQKEAVQYQNNVENFMKTYKDGR